MGIKHFWQPFVYFERSICWAGERCRRHSSDWLLQGEPDGDCAPAGSGDTAGGIHIPEIFRHLIHMYIYAFSLIH